MAMVVSSKVSSFIVTPNGAEGAAFRTAPSQGNYRMDKSCGYLAAGIPGYLAFFPSFPSRHSFHRRNVRGLERKLSS